MAERSGFFNAVQVETLGEFVWDRTYLAQHFAEYFNKFISNGVYAGSPSQLTVSPAGGFNLSMASGAAFINGYYYVNEGAKTITIDTPSAANNRIDRIVLRWYNAEREIKQIVLKGEPAASPVPPALSRNEDYYDISLCQIEVLRTATEIKASNIKDERANNAVCGWVHGLIDQVDTTTLYNQIQADLAGFKANEEAQFATWSAAERAAYELWVQTHTASYEAWIAAQETTWEEWSSMYRASYEAWVSAQELEFENWSQAVKSDFENWMQNTKDEYEAWIATIQEIINEEVATNLLRLIWDLTPYADAVYDDVAKIVTLTMRQQKAVGNKEYPIQFKAPVAYSQSHVYVLHNSFENTDTNMTVENIQGGPVADGAWSAGVMVQLVRDSDTLFYQGNAADMQKSVYATGQVDNENKVDRAIVADNNVLKTGDVMTGNLDIETSDNPGIKFKPENSRGAFSWLLKNLVGDGEDVGTILRDYSASSTYASLILQAKGLSPADKFWFQDFSSGANKMYRAYHEGNPPPEGGKKYYAVVVGTSASGHKANEVDFLCDGVDDQIEINMAMTTAAMIGGKSAKVILREGTYNLTGSVNAYTTSTTSMTLEGQGMGTILKRMFNTTEYSTNSLVRVGGNGGWGQLKNLLIDGNSATYTSTNNVEVHCLWSSTSVRRSIVEDVYIYNSAGTMTIYAQSAAYIRGCVLDNCGAIQIHELDCMVEGCKQLNGHNKQLIISSQRAKISDCTIIGYASTGTPLVTLGASDVTMEGCYIANMAGKTGNTLMYVNGSRNKIVGCTFIATVYTEYALTMGGGSGNVVSGCTFAVTAGGCINGIRFESGSNTVISGCFITGFSYGIEFATASAKDVVVTGCLCKNCTSAGIHATAGGALTIVGNTCRGTGTYSIRMESATLYCLVAGNILHVALSNAGSNNTAADNKTVTNTNVAL